jgi:hypothetical protein
MRVRIVSHWEGRTWEGDVPPAPEGMTVLEHVFRYFNRVDQADIDRLDELDYQLPSLSVSDVVTIDDGPRWRCAGVGWELADEPTTDPMVKLQQRLTGGS